MNDRIVVDFYALDRIAKQLGNAGSELNAAMSQLANLHLTRDSGAYLQLNGADISLRSVGGTVSASTVTQAIQSYRSTLGRLSAYSDSLAGAVGQTSSKFSRTDAALGRGLDTGDFSAKNNETTDATPTTSQGHRSWIAKFLNNELKESGSFLSGDLSGEGLLWGVSTAGAVSGSILYGEAGIKSKMNWKWKDKDGNWDFKSFGLSTEAKATGAVAKGSAEGNFGYLHGKLEGSVLTGAVSGNVKATLWDDGRFNPSLSAGLKGEGSAISGNAEAGIGTDQYGVYGKADGQVLHAEGEAKIGIGYIQTDNSGNAQYGIVAEGKGMASIAQGKVKGGVTIFGIDIDVGIEGYAGAVGGKAGGYITTKGVKGKIGGALGLGAGLEVSVDWSDAKWLGDAADTIWNWLGWW